VTSVAKGRDTEIAQNILRLLKPTDNMTIHWKVGKHILFGIIIPFWKVCHVTHKPRIDAGSYNTHDINFE
jgi:hypothetical protein